MSSKKGNKVEFREKLLKIKIHFGVKTNKELAFKLGISEDAVKAWTKKKEIPKKYEKILEDTLKSNNEDEEINEYEILSESINAKTMSKNIYKMCQNLDNKDILDIFQYTLQKWIKQKREKEKL